MASRKTDIASALLARLDFLATKTINYKSFDVVKLEATDFQEWDLPAVQVIDLEETNTHEMRRGRKSWDLQLEVILGPTSLSTPTQNELWDLMQEIEIAIMQTPQLNLSYVIGVRLTGSATDLHLMNPFYLGVLQFTIDYYQALVDDC